MKKNKRLRQSVNTRPSIQEEKGYKMAWVFPSLRIGLCSLKRMSVLAEYHMIDFWQIHGREAKSP